MVKKLTKIIATIGPACDLPQMIADLIEDGINVFRFNTKHNTIAWHEQRIKLVQKIAVKKNLSVGILIDLQGPELRLETPNQKEYPVKKDQVILFTPSFLPLVDSICIPHTSFFQAAVKNDGVLIDNGLLEFTITELSQDKVWAKSHQSGIIRNRKGVNLPGKKFNLSSLINADLKRLDMAARNKIDFVALSFSRKKEDLTILRQELKKRKMTAGVIAKIESQEALDNLDELVSESDGIMIARGDLGVEVPIEQLTYWQKIIIHKCRQANKPVITATQMLQSMINSPLPTRAEATDIANAVFDGTDTLMLSGETASGMYPEKSVMAMAKIAAYNEKIVSLAKIQTKLDSFDDLLIEAAANIINNQITPKLDSVVVFTQSGKTAKALSSYRPKIPIIAVSEDQATIDQLTLSFAVFPVKAGFNNALSQLKKSGLIKAQQYILIVHGHKRNSAEPTNTLTVYHVR